MRSDHRSHRRIARYKAELSTRPKRANSDATTSSTGSGSDMSAFGDMDVEPPVIEYQPDDLDEPLSWAFQDGDPVWVKTEEGEWLQGTVNGKSTRRGATRQKEGVFFPVSFRISSRKYFAPLNGDVKPDTPEVRRLLLEGGWL
ncbi:hypothetical protein BKA93DRAFT_824784 [Sparassis latifolia]|uniref:Uncharacterized protein n=1 Tax=Sparassis crispa TaxID=139825 RepID=A0A401G961_9APHY|nr:hypothetical protein SCP_0115890 [Sparassis crispa]GBE78698.1 hypothetical protein SCP_0115890 [Sparassis crispa]